MARFYDPELYDASAQGIPGDVEFFLGLARQAHEAGLPVLELAAGTGRIAIPIAQAGISVVGFDQEPSMLAHAAKKSGGSKNVRWVEGDMRNFALEERFGLVFIAFRSFQHLLTIDDQLACLRCVRDHLAPGGRLAINIFNPDIAIMGQWLTTKRGSVRARQDDVTHPASGRTVKAWETRSYHPATQEARSQFIDEEVADDGVVASKVYRGLRLRYIFRYEMEHLLIRAGYEVEALYGDCHESPFEDTSPEMIWLARPAAG